MATAVKDAKPSTVKAVLAEALRKYDLKVGPLSSVTEGVQAVTTGNLAIDHIFGVDGVPLGRSVELYGPPSSGKTTLALQAAAELQKLIIAGGDPERGISATDCILYMDYEHSMDITYAKALGLDVDHASFLFGQPDSLEQGAQVALNLIQTGAVRMAIWDSVASMNPEAALDAEVGASLPAILARVLGGFLRTLNAALHEHNCCSIFVNHQAEKMEMGGYKRPGSFPQVTTPGGRALKFYASVRVEFAQIGTIKGKVWDPIGNEEIERVVATNVRIKVVKNKLAPPFKQCIARVRFGKGFDNFWTAMQVLVAHKHIVYSAGYFYFEKSPALVHEEMNRQASGNHRPYIQGENSLFAFADTHVDWRAATIAAAEAVVNQAVDALDAITPVTGDVADAEQDVEPEEPVDAPVGDTEAAMMASSEQTRTLLPAQNAVELPPELLDPAPPGSTVKTSTTKRVQLVDPTDSL